MNWVENLTLIADGFKLSILYIYSENIYLFYTCIVHIHYIYTDPNKFFQLIYKKIY